MRPAHVQALSCMPQRPLPTVHRCRTRATSAAQAIEPLKFPNPRSIATQGNRETGGRY